MPLWPTANGEAAVSVSISFTNVAVPFAADRAPWRTELGTLRRTAVNARGRTADGAPEVQTPPLPLVDEARSGQHSRTAPLP